MKLNVLQEKISAFGELLRSASGDSHLYKYGMVAHFADHWTFDTDDFAAMYDQCLQSAVTKRWWKRDHYRPKEVMLDLIRTEEQYVREAFKELFNEQKLSENRVDRFVFYCDELLRMYKKLNPKSVVNNHYQDGSIISLYLAALYPDKYTLYPGRRIFNEALLALGAQGTGEKDDLPRFFKIALLILTYLNRNAGVQDLITKGIRGQNPLMAVHEFVYFVAGAWQESTPV